MQKLRDRDQHSDRDRRNKGMSREQQRKTQRGETEIEREAREAARRVGPAAGRDQCGRGRGSFPISRCSPQTLSLSQEDGSTALPDDNAVCANFN